MFSLFGNKSKGATSEETFWNWFISNKTRIEKFIDSKQTSYSIYNKLTEKIQTYHKLLFPELTKDKEDRYILVITADGLKEGLEPVQKLAAASPKIDNWRIHKFRQPCDEITLNLLGVEFPASDIKILAQIDREKEVVDVDIFITNMNLDVKKYQGLACLYLDHILGEFNSITKVGYIEFHHLEKGQNVNDSITLLQLRNLIAEELY